VARGARRFAGSRAARIAESDHRRHDDRCGREDDEQQAKSERSHDGELSWSKRTESILPDPADRETSR
jgi:hypothetical protein